MNKQELYNKMVEHLKENVDTISELVSHCNGWNGSLEDYAFYENSKYFFNDYFYNDPFKAVEMTSTDDYNFNDDFVRFTIYGLESFSKYECEELLKDNVNEILDNYIDLVEQKKLDPNDIYGDDTIKMYFNKYIDLLEGETTDNEQ